MLRIYINKDSEQRANELFPKDNKIMSGKLRFELDEKTGELYTDLYSYDPFDPTFAMPAIPEEMINRFTIRGILIDNQKAFRIEGIYKVGKATLRCSQKLETIEVSHFGDINDFDLYPSDTPYRRLVYRQIVDICAPTLQELIDIYSQFRQGQILPTENWEAPQVPATSKQPTE